MLIFLNIYIYIVYSVEKWKKVVLDGHGHGYTRVGMLLQSRKSRLRGPWLNLQTRNLMVSVQHESSVLMSHSFVSGGKMAM